MAKTTRFSPAFDICLLKEVVSINPNSKTGTAKERAWETVCTQVNAALARIRPEANKISIRACKDRLKHLVAVKRRNEMASLRASGTDEDYDEREQLLTGLIEMMEEDERERVLNKEKEGEKENQKEAQGEAVRQAALEGLVKDVDTPKKVRKTAATVDYLAYLKEKHRQDLEMRKEELKFEREKLELEKQEREQRMAREQALINLLTKAIQK